MGSKVRLRRRVGIARSGCLRRQTDITPTTISLSVVTFKMDILVEVGTHAATFKMRVSPHIVKVLEETLFAHIRSFHHLREQKWFPLTP